MVSLLIIAGSLLSWSPTLLSDPLRDNLTKLSQSLTTLQSTISWPPASFIDWLKKENLISAEHELSGLPDGITASFYRVRVMPQMGATCSVHSWYNLAWFTLLLNAETLQKAEYAAAMIHDKAEFEKICAPIAEKITSGFSLPGFNKEIITQLPAESKKYFPDYSFKHEIPSDFFGGEKLPLFYDLFINRKRSGYGFHWYHDVLGGHYIAFIAARRGNDFSFFILDSICHEGSLDSHIAQYEPIARNFINWCLNPEKIYTHNLTKINEFIEMLTADQDVNTNSDRSGELVIKDIENQIATLDRADQTIFESSRKAYEQIRNTRITEWQKINPAITLDTIRSIDLRKKH